MDSIFTKSELTLVHYSNKPIEKLNPICYLQDSYHFKPVGFWFSINEEWADWCTEEKLNLENLAYSYLIKLKPEANILYLRSPEDTDDFSNLYNEPIIGIYTAWSSYKINWTKVTECYDGIIIAPYQYSRRFELMWYYTWVCASGCIWNLDIIESISQHYIPQRT